MCNFFYRSENSKPTKRYYQPKMITSGRPPASKPEETRTAQSDMGSMATATAAAAAAVAATVPLLKVRIQPSLELMNK